MERIIEITIPLEGATTVEALGFSGPACKLATKLYEEALFNVAPTVTAKPEMQQATTQQQVQR